MASKKPALRLQPRSRHRHFGIRLALSLLEGLLGIAQLALQHAQADERRTDRLVPCCRRGPGPAKGAQRAVGCRPADRHHLAQCVEPGEPIRAVASGKVELPACRLDGEDERALALGVEALGFAQRKDAEGDLAVHTLKEQQVARQQDSMAARPVACGRLSH